MSDSSRTQLVYRPETTFAEVPIANAPTTRLRFKSESLDHQNTTIVSEEIRSDRQRSGNAVAGYNSGGDIVQELIYGAELEAFLQAALGGTWTANVLKNGVVNRSFNIEKAFLDKNIFLNLRGSVLGRLALNITSGAYAEMTTTWKSAQGYITGTSIGGSTAPTDPAANDPISSGDLIELMDAGGTNVDLSGEKVRAITIQIENNLRDRNLATQHQSDDFGRGSQVITGTLETYLNQSAIYAAMKANSWCELRFSVQDPVLATANQIEFLFPAVKLSTAPTPIGGVDTDIMQVVNWQAFYDAGVGYAVNVTRAVTGA